jgi:surfeit locus 1 family protein
MTRIRFQPTLWPTLAAIAGIVLTLALGNWQLARGREKAALADRTLAANQSAPVRLPEREISAEDFAWRRVEVRGRFDPARAVLIDNRISRGVAGYHVVMPLRIGDSAQYVLVNRGWVAGTAVRTELPKVTTPREEVVISGLATVPGRRFLELSTKVAEGNVWQNLTIERYRAVVPISIQPVVIEQENNIEDGLRREWAEPEFGVDKHYGYAFQWFAMSLAILIFYISSHVRKRPRQPQ